MSDLRKLADNVWSFLNDTSARIGRMHAERFSQDAFVSCIEGPESPIEDLFLIAVHAQCQAEYIEVNRGPTLYQDGGPAIHDGIYVRPQVAIGSFRVLHFTGSEVVADPHKVAYEALEMLGVYSGSCRKYDPMDPLGTGE